jgi:hypothetical protein
MRYHYDREVTQSLEMDVPPIIGYYWLDGTYLRYWAPYVSGTRKYGGTVPLDEVCRVLNSLTKDYYSNDPHLRVDRDAYMSNRHCILVRGGPLDTKCIISHYVLPMGVVDVLGLTITERVSLPSHDLWELVLSPCGDTHIYLVGGGKYTIWYADEYVLTKRADMAEGEVVCTDTLEYCRAISGHLKAAYRAGADYAITRVGNLLTKL